MALAELPMLTGKARQTKTRRSVTVAEDRGNRVGPRHMVVTGPRGPGLSRLTGSLRLVANLSAAGPGDTVTMIVTVTVAVLTVPGFTQERARVEICPPNTGNDSEDRGTQPA
eukprot:2879756-Rhodomonas_salina.1